VAPSVTVPGTFICCGANNITETSRRFKHGAIYNFMASLFFVVK
jgi:hypothetical protein